VKGGCRVKGLGFLGVSGYVSGLGVSGREVVSGYVSG
jgi:hypothetical protein